jgi:hypothetical protein
MSEQQKRLNFSIYKFNPFFAKSPAVEFYDESRDDQVEDLDNFINLSKNLKKNNVYDKYKSFFYKYHDYNQINR